MVFRRLLGLSLLLAFPFLLTWAGPEAPRPFSFRGTSLRPIEVVPVYALSPEIGLRARQAAQAPVGKPGPLIVGQPARIDINPSHSGLWEELPGGARVWRLTVTSPGALWLAFGFHTFRLPPGAELRLFDPTGRHVLGPYSAPDVRNHGELWLPPLEGASGVVELFWPAHLGPVPPDLVLGTVSHGFRPVFGAGEEKIGVGDSGACEIDINCPLGADWQDAKHGVVTLLSDGSAYCSGSLIANAAGDCSQFYVLTAYHCLSTQDEATRTVFQFNFERPNCGSGSAPTNQTISGSTLVAKYRETDFALVRLSSPPLESYQPYFNGWSRLETPAAQAWGIHHPSGDVKKISHSPNPLKVGTYYTSGPHWRVEWQTNGSEGVTEGGSSGSPLFDPVHRIVGQLHGGESSCSAAPASMWDEYGQFKASWSGGGTPESRLKDWLDPAGSGAMEQAGYYAFPCGAVNGPNLVVEKTTVSDPLGNGNGVAEPGERFQLIVDLKNSGKSGASAVSGKLSTSTPGVSILKDEAAWDDIPVGQTRSSRPPHFTIQVDPAVPCGTQIALHLVSQAKEAPGVWAYDFTLSVGAQSLVTVFGDDMENGEGGWKRTVAEGFNTWSLNTKRPKSPTHSWTIPEATVRTDASLVMATLNTLPAGAVLTFQHNYDTVKDNHGGVLEISQNGGPYLDAGSLITDGSYNSVISSTASTPLAGRKAWSGTSAGFKQVTVDLSSKMGQNIVLRWRFATNALTTSKTGWSLDDVLVTALQYNCAPVPAGEASEEGTVPFRIVKSGTGFLLNWSAPGYGGPVLGYKLYRTVLTGGGPFQPVCEADLGTGLSQFLPLLTDNSGFMVVARNAAGEGSYGQTSDGAERPRASGAGLCP